MRCVSCVSLCLAVPLLFAGCSGKKETKYSVKGKLTSGGQALKASSTGEVGLPPAAGSAGRGVQLIFYPLPDGERPADPIKAGLVGVHATVDEDGSFEVPTKLRPGKYVIAVHVRPRGPQGPDDLKDVYSFKNSKIVEEIEGNRTIDIELDNYK